MPGAKRGATLRKVGPSTLLPSKQCGARCKPCAFGGQNVCILSYRVQSVCVVCANKLAGTLRICGNAASGPRASTSRCSATRSVGGICRRRRQLFIGFLLSTWIVGVDSAVIRARQRALLLRVSFLVRWQELSSAAGQVRRILLTINSYLVRVSLRHQFPAK